HAHDPEQRNVRSGGGRAAENMLAAIAERTLARLDKCRRVKPLDPALGETAPCIAHLLGPFVTRERAVANVARCLDREWKSSPKGNNGAGHPVTQYLTQRTSRHKLLPRAHRNLPG